MSKGLVVSPDKCSGCRTCELACSYSKSDYFNPKDAAVSVMFYDEIGLEFPMMCLQCDDPHCVSVCVVDALTKDQKTGVVNYDKDKCIGCKMCVSACPFGNITYSSRLNRIIKCDMCSGDPQCVKMCAYGAIEYRELDGTLDKRRIIANQIREALGEGGK